MKKSVHLITLAVYILSLLLANAGTAQAAETSASTKIMHTPPAYFIPGHRIAVKADVTDKAGITVARCYFRATDQADYVFVSLNPATDGTYEGILPAPSKETQTVTYLFLAVNGKGKIVKTESFSVNKIEGEEIPAWQQTGSEGNIQVSTELAKAPESVSGFSDSITMDVTESSARFGAVSGGIYAATAGSAGSAAATAGAAGAVGASTGLSTTALVGIGAGVAAVAGGIAALAGGGGGTNPPPDEKPTVLSASPRNGETVSTGLREVTISFSEAMADRHKVTVNSPDWQNADYNWINSTTFRITRVGEGDMPDDAEIVFTLYGGDSGFSDLAGTPLDTYTFSITTGGGISVSW